jgi:hypothetical protein
MKGVVYYLPMSEFDITLTRTLRACSIILDSSFTPQGTVTNISGTTVTGNEHSRFKTEFKKGEWIVIGYQARTVDEDPTRDNVLKTTQPFNIQLPEPLPYGKPADGTPSSPDVQAELSATVETRTLPDNEQAYLIDYEILASWMKQTNVSIDLYDNGTLKAINASLADKSSEVILNVVKSGVAIAKMVMGGPSATDATSLQTVYSPCQNQISQALLDLPWLNKQIAALTRQRDAYMQMLKTVTFVTDSTTRQVLQEFLKDTESTQKAIEILSARQKQIIKRLTVVERVRFVPMAGKSSQPFPLPKQISEDWFNPDHLNTVDNKNLFTAVVTAQVIVAPPAGSDKSKECQTGIVYRNPAQAILSICPGKSCINDKGNPTPGVEELYRARTVIPQMGKIARLPLKNTMFQSKTLMAAFSQDGVLTKLTFSNEAAAEKASATLAQALPSISKLMEDQKTAATQNITHETEKIQAEIDREKARRELDQLLKSP